MIEDPACRAGKVISPRPPVGPEDNSRRSAAILARMIAAREQTPARVA